MEIKEESKFKGFVKNYGAVIISSFFIIAIALTLIIVGLSPKGDDAIVDNSSQIEEEKPVGTKPIEYVLPMANASVIKDFSNTELQYNQTLNRWEAHMSIDFMSLDADVMAICDGVVRSIEKDYLMGNVVTVEHENGLVSVYASLDDGVKVAVGDSVKSGQVIGVASTTANSEASDGAHLDFAMLLDGQEVDPNNYLELQNK